MASRKDSRDGDRFRVKPAAPKSRSGPRSQRFVSQILKAVSKAGADASSPRGARPASTFGRGRVAAGIAGKRLGANARRVVVKSRFVVLKKAATGSVAAHLRYVERDGVTRDGQRGRAYGAATDAADLKAFAERGQGDRHQFRFIVSVQDAEQLEDLRGYTRELMRRMEVDLETRLDWVAVDHWDTDNPHTHVVLRGRIGRARTGRDLVIAPDYVANGMRMRASEIATEWLGPRTELEIRQGLQREVAQERLTSLDRMLLRQAVGDVVDLTRTPEKPTDLRQRQNLQRARLQQLESMGLAERLPANRWRLAPGMERSLAVIGERRDIVRAMQRAMRGERRELAIETVPAMPIVGRIAGKGLADEFHERGYLVVDGIDGRVHYLKLAPGADLAALPIGGIVQTKPPGQEREVDRNIAAVARDGVYRTAEHLAQLEQANDGSPQFVVNVHVRRLEALRRTGVVERVADGVWKVPTNLTVKAQQHDAQKASGSTIELRSHLRVDQQVRANGATWLDRQLIEGGNGLAAHGFGVQVRDAMRKRADFLIEQGLAEHKGWRVVLARELLSTLQNRELAAVGRSLQDQTGLTYRRPADGGQVSGVYSRSIQLASGRFAVLEDGVGFSLVPWRQAIERSLGQQVSAVVRGQSVIWQLGRQQGLSV
jgi:type IV secretory pathway VirD2 relaxase